MKIIVLVKQASDPYADIHITDNFKAIDESKMDWVVNPLDEIAIEEALRLRQIHGGKVTAMTAGGPQSSDILRFAMAMGADHGIWVKTSELSWHDPLRTSRILAAALKSMEYDLIIAGHRSMDDDNHLVGPCVAEMIKRPLVTGVIKTEIKGNKIICTQMTSDGRVKTETSLPSLISTHRGLNEPRYTSFLGRKKAAEKEIVEKSLEDIGMTTKNQSNPVTLVKIARLKRVSPERTGIVISGGSLTDRCEKLARIILRESRGGKGKSQ